MKLAWHTRGAATAYRSRRLMELRGVTPSGHPLWRPPEVDTIVGGNRDYQAIFPQLNRTRPAIYNKASRLGMTNRRAPPWSDNEILRLRRLYPTGTRAEIEGAFPGRTYSAISKAANARGIVRLPRPYKPTGILIIDQIMMRARAQKWTLVELDTEIQTPRYFSKRRWKTRVNPTAHFRAVALLGGTVRARFPGQVGEGSC